MTFVNRLNVHAQAAYTRAIQEETTKAVVPPDTDVITSNLHDFHQKCAKSGQNRANLLKKTFFQVPLCDCGAPCELMEYFPEGEDGSMATS